jgi:hypothetical protein
MPKQFWVIGAEYRDTEFIEPVEGSSTLLGPYASYEQARRTWQERSQSSRHAATRRYTIVSNGSGMQ